MPWKQGLPTPKLDSQGTLMLEPALAREVEDHLAFAQRVPDLCEKAITEATQNCEAPSWDLPFWIVPIAGVLGFAFGFYLGYGHS